MKRLFVLLSICAFSIGVMAQKEIPVDTMRHTLNAPEMKVKQFGDYVLDMRLLNLKPATMMPHSSMLNPTLTKDYGSMFALGSGSAYGIGYTNDFTPTNRWFDYASSYYPYPGYVFDYMSNYGIHSNADMLQGASFRLNNGMRLNIYGKYDANGHLLPGMNVMPWQKHDFSGAFELRSKDGKFGFSVEVKRENTPY